ncbi:hypothetical protein V6U71_08010 [Sphingopyxis sp. J-6]|uniref:hypothetical protein n=1 Tax=Sphingopyxis sp. J-6 TaxID=3122054 RepID=UPI003983F602
MQRRFSTAFVSILAMTFTVFTVSAETTRTPSIFYNSSAEAVRDFDSFPQSHPSCAIWTNWQKVCSRTGKNRELHCKKAAVQIRPSKVFCAAEYEGGLGGPRSDAPALEQASFLRFCNVPDGFSGSYSERLEYCDWQPDRPFNGRRLAELKHPWCERWVKIPHLRPTKERPGDPGAYYCAKRSIPSWCDWADGMGQGPQIDSKSRNEEILPVRWSSKSQFMHQTFCRRVSANSLP